MMREAAGRSEAHPRNDHATVAIADADASAREKLCAVVEQAGLTAVSYDSVHTLLHAVGTACPQVVLADMDLPSPVEVDLAAEVSRRCNETPVILLIHRIVARRIVDALKAGAFDVLPKASDAADVLASVQNALKKNARLHDERIRFEGIRTRLANLTARERGVLDLALIGLSNKEIGRELGISHRTVEVHRQHILQKTGASTLLEVANLTTLIRLASGNEARRGENATTSDDAPSG
jgi:two-component system, LuxR family, response regulator FixJ